MSTKKKLEVSDVRNPWHVVHTLKDMPGTSRDILLKSDMGWTFVGYWDAHKRQVEVSTIRNHWNNEAGCYELDGKVDYHRIKLNGDDRGMCSAWCDIPRDNDDWE